MDLEAGKHIALTERVHLEFRAELFNIFNRPLYGQPQSDFSAGAVLQGADGSCRDSRSEGAAGRTDRGVHAATDFGGWEDQLQAYRQIDFSEKAAFTQPSGAGGPAQTERHIPFTFKVAS
jgi:hypothetical protein